MISERSAWGFGLATITDDGVTLDTWYPEPALGAAPADASAPAELEALVGKDEVRRVRRELVQVGSTSTRPRLTPPTPTCGFTCSPTALAEPNTINLDGIFGALTNVVWTTQGPCAVDGFEVTRARLQAARSGPGVRRRQVPTDGRLRRACRSADRRRRPRAPRARTSPPGTTVMHEGFVNFNAGTLGTSMVEGRISQGVVVGDGSDIGGGASTMGTLSGGGTERVRIGERCLLGAESGLGIALGDDCVVEAGLYLTAGTKVTLPDGQVVKARELSGQDSLLFLRNSVTGAVEARARDGHGIVLNSALHAND